MWLGVAGLVGVIDWVGDCVGGLWVECPPGPPPLLFLVSVAILCGEVLVTLTRLILLAQHRTKLQVTNAR